MFRSSILIAVLLLGAGFALQPGANASEKQLAKNEAKPAAASVALIDGEVRRVDKAAGSVVIKHGPMPKFDMPGMTMPYRVKDKSMLDQLNPGDKIKFDADSVGGVFTVVRLERQK